MKTINGLTLTLVLLVSSLCWAEADPADESANPAASDKRTISTQVGGLDTLGLVPNEVETSYEGGTRRMNLERSVFRREEPVVYAASSRRDPFRPLISDENRGGEIKTDLLIIDGANLTGVVWAEGQYLAMVKDKERRTFFLREGDAVYSGRVVTVAQTHIVVELSSFGEYRQVTLKVND